MTVETAPVQALLDRSHRLGADPRTTNYAGGNTSAKGTAIDPATGLPVDLLWVKGSGGDLGTLTQAGLAVLRLDRLRALVDVYPGVEREDEMVAAFDYCLHGRGGAAPSIDTAMHALVETDHVDHLHPDAGIAFATAADGEALTHRCFGDRVAWVPWRRPGFQLGLDMAAIRRDRPEAIGAILGGHGITAWGDTSDACEANSLEIIRTAERFIEEHGRTEPFGAVVPGLEPLPEADRRARAARAAPGHPRPGLDGPAAGRALHRLGGRARLRVARGASAARRARDVVPGPLPADQGRADGRRPAAERHDRGDRRAPQGAARRLPRRLPRLLRAQRDPRQPGDARRRPGDRAGPRRRHVQLRRQQADGAGGRRVLRQRDQRDARRRGALDLRADRRVREVPHRVLGARGGQARAAARSRSRWRPGSRW